MRKKFVAGNWKMHGSQTMAHALVSDIVAGMPASVDVAVFPPFPYIAPLAGQFAETGLGIGGQDISEHEGQGAYTGEVSAAMLADVGAQWTLVGHSERRKYHGESNELVARKFAAALAGGLTPILCVGESLEQREAGQTEAVIAGQPCWAIGTGCTATPEQAQQVHAFIRSQLEKEDGMIARLTRLLYGGSVKAANAAQLFAQADVDGGLIGGAALTASDFLGICAAAQ
jgi:triosephosphate isomerase